mgnify:CR=1 FL=1
MGRFPEVHDQTENNCQEKAPATNDANGSIAPQHNPRAGKPAQSTAQSADDSWDSGEVPAAGDVAKTGVSHQAGDALEMLLADFESE